MWIDTSFPNTSKYFLYLDVPYRYSKHHFEIAFNPDTAIPFSERAIHFSLGVIHVIPIIGHIAAIANRILNPTVDFEISEGQNPRAYPRREVEGPLHVESRNRLENIEEIRAIDIADRADIPQIETHCPPSEEVIRHQTAILELRDLFKTEALKVMQEKPAQSYPLKDF